MARKKPRSTDPAPLARQFAEGAEPLIGGRSDDPAEAAEAREAELLARRIKTEPEYKAIVERQYLEDESIAASKKAAYHRLKANEKQQFLITWKAYGMDE